MVATRAIEEAEEAELTSGRCGEGSVNAVGEVVRGGLAQASSETAVGCGAPTAGIETSSARTRGDKAREIRLPTREREQET